jgi:pimeloyl-ACP methyl ester carboxylesterase
VTDFVTSPDGTRIAYDRLGEGPPLVIVSGIFCARPTTRELAERLAADFTVVNYDRRGLGESTDTPPYAVTREVEDVMALMAALGGSAAVYGHSSGAGVALHSAAAGLPITRLVLHEPPYGGDDEESTASARSLAADVLAALADDRPGDAIARFFADMGMPDEVVAATASDPAMLAVAPTMAYDIAVMGDVDGGTVPDDLARSVAVPTLVLAGADSPDFFRATATRLTTLIPDAHHTVLPNADHGAPASQVAPAITPFLTP